MLDTLTFSRHDLLLLAKNSQVTADAADTGLIKDWLACGRPVIVRRPCHTAAGLHCGISLPPEQSGKRIAFSVDPVYLRKRLSLPHLPECMSLLPESRRKSLTALAELRPQVFGSLAWQYLTGLPYLHEQSDIDLLFRVDSRAELRKLNAALVKIKPDPKCDIEIILWHGRAFSWRELQQKTAKVMLKGNYDISLCGKSFLLPTEPDAEFIAAEAQAALYEELETYPKPGLVSYVDTGSHSDMDVNHFRAGITALWNYFKAIAEAGTRGATLAELRRLGLEAEARMLTATDDVNTHRGAIFSLGMLAAAAGYKANTGTTATLGEIVKNLWGKEIMAYRNPGSHGEEALKRYGGSGARAEAANGFPSVYRYGLPTFTATIARQSRNSARLNSFYSMLNHINDTTLLHRGGRSGHDFAVKTAANFNCAADHGKAELAKQNHFAFIERNLSCGGVADLLAATVFINNMEELWLES